MTLPFEIMDTPHRRPLKSRSFGDVRASVIHNTGETDLDAIIATYESGVCPHFLIQTNGTVRQFARLDQIAAHAKLYPLEREAYERGFKFWSTCTWDAERERAVPSGRSLPNYAPWAKTWPGLGSPLELPTGTRPNSFSVGIEMQKPLAGQITADIFTDVQYDRLHHLLRYVHGGLSMPLDRKRLLGHYDVNPLRRSNSKGGWDPGINFNWVRLFGLLGILQPG